MKIKVLIPILLMIIFLVFFNLFLNGCSKEEKTIKNETDKINQTINPADFAGKIDNAYFTLTPGTTFIFEGATRDGTEHIEVVVTTQTKNILDIDTTVVWDRVWLEEELIEETYDWYAQDNKGNVWYFGEDSKEYEDGEVISTKGSWEAGIDGAKPGIIMEESPKIGDSYHEEYYQGEAEDMAEIISLDESIKVAYGSFEHCLKTKNWTPLEPGIVEYKYYSTEVSNVILETSAEGNERIELIDIIAN